ncbi:MAG: metalloregulator ArsR/SmtB family transcription factor [Kastovskya adunca ATA6-11-RM4]|jgi:DNA-binding transcriptional ArsR family regulator|nr:metalloregulator ArsR/SmtB family transcription factor [Kastovskya adunca ATA6-11-RM4]
MIEKNTHTQPLALPAIEQNDSERRAKIFAALSDPTRLRIVELLAATDELSGSEIAHQIDISLALFCHHSKTLAEAGLIQTRKEGQTKYNSLNWELISACFSSFTHLRDRT